MTTESRKAIPDAECPYCRSEFVVPIVGEIRYRMVMYAQGLCLDCQARGPRVELNARASVTLAAQIQSSIRSWAAREDSDGKDG